MGLRERKVSHTTIWSRIPIISAFSLFLLCSCAENVKPRYDEVYRSTEYYKVPSRVKAPEPVYGRMTWSHLPEQQVQRSKSDAPFIDPKFSFELPNSNFEEAIEALAQAIGYRWNYPKNIASRQISINMVGTVSEILQEICKQARVSAELDNEERVIRVRNAN